MRNICAKIAESDVFERIVIFLIVLCSLSMGAETDPTLASDFELYFDFIFYISQAFFCFEIVVRIAAHAPRYLSFFRGFWNWFDFLIVAASLIPAIGSFALVARILRVLRVLRLVSVSDSLRLYLDKFLGTLDVISYSAIVWAVMVYVFAVSGFYLFGESSSEYYGDFWRAARTVVYLCLLQDVSTIAEEILTQSAAAAAYFLLLYAALFSLVLNTFAAVMHDYACGPSTAREPAK